MKRLLWTIQAALFYCFTLAVSSIPACLVPRAGLLTGKLLFRLLSGRRRIAIDNIRQALPFMKQHPAWSSTLGTAEEIARETFIHLGMSIVEICRLYHGKGDATISTIEVRGREHFDQARSKHQGLIFVGGHCGNWELMALAFKRLFGENMAGIARKQNNPFLNTVIERMRTRYDNQIIYKQGALRPILGILKKNGVVGMLADQAVFPEDGALIDVLGRKAWANKAPVIIANKSKVPLVPVFIHRENGLHVITVYPEYQLCGDTSEAGIQQDVQGLSRYLENFICAHPADWYWVHRRWKRAGEYVQ
jgi:KDO2-lipid IV(A) lauroyltransferase